MNSRTWFLRQTSDPFVKQARIQAYRSRAAFKLIQMEKQVRLFRGARKVLDLGAAPGGWSQVAIQHIGDGLVIAVDLLPLEPLEGVLSLQGNFTNAADRARIGALLGGQPADLILSDMAPKLSGIAGQDHLASIELVRQALNFSRDWLRLGGHLLVKILQGRHEQEVRRDFEVLFAHVRWLKPEASRKESAERYLIGMHKK